MQGPSDRSGQIVRVGFYENPPKIFSDNRGRPAGLFVDLLDAVARDERWQVDYRPCVWNQCLQWLETGALDLMPDVAYSPVRAERFDFNELSVASSWSQVYSADRVRVHRLEDLDDKRVAILRGSVQEVFFERLMRTSGLAYRPVPVDSYAQGYQAVASGEADAVITNSFYAARNAHLYQLRETPIVFLPTNLYFATGRGRNGELRAAIDDHLRRWREDPDSLYFQALRRSMGPAPEIHAPHWVGRTLLLFGAALLGLIALSLLLRWQVNRRTRALLDTTRELAAQRAAFERLASARGGELQALFDAANVGIVLIENRVIQRGNRHLDELFGYEPGEQEGCSTRIWYPDEARFRRAGAEIYPALARGEEEPRELQFQRKNGELFWARLSGRALDRSNPRAGMVGIIEDITAEHEAAEALRLAHAEQEAILASASVGIILMRDRVIVRCNHRFEQMLGYGPGELLGRSTRVLYPDDESWERIGREGYQAVWRGETDVREQRLLRKDGQILWARLSARAVSATDPSKGTVSII